MQIRKEEVQYIETTPMRVIHDDDISALRGELPPHWHEEIELDYVLNGIVNYTINGVSYRVCAGEIAVIGSGAVHSGFCHQGERIKDTHAEVLTVLLDARLFAPFASGGRLHFKPLLRESENVELRDIMTELGIAYLRKDPYYELILHADAMRLCYSLLMKHRASDDAAGSVLTSSLGMIKTALRYIEEHCTEKMCLEQIAAIVKYNPSYFSRRFHQLTGLTFSEYLNRCRGKEAARLLRETDSTVSSIAFACGFPSVSSFITFFKRQYQTTPDRFRRLAREEKTKK